MNPGTVSGVLAVTVSSCARTTLLNPSQSSSSSAAAWAGPERLMGARIAVMGLSASIASSSARGLLPVWERLKQNNVGFRAMAKGTLCAKNRTDAATLPLAYVYGAGAVWRCARTRLQLTVNAADATDK